MAKVEVLCPQCSSNQIVKYGTSSTLKQRYLCRNNKCNKNTFILDYSQNGSITKVKDKIIEMALNGSGVRDTARVLNISVNTVISTLKKRA